MKGNRTLISARDVIRALATRGAMTPSEIASLTGIARSSAYRLVEGLMAVGLAETLPDSRVRLTNRWLHLADKVVPSMREWANASEILNDLAAKSEQTAYLSVRRDLRAVCIDWAQGRGIDLLILKPGRTLPLYAGGAGRNILAHTPALVERVVESAPPPFTTHTLTDEHALRADIERTLRDGYTLSHEDVTMGIGAIGTAITRHGEYLGCLSVAGLIQDIKSGQDSLVNQLEAAADRLANGLAPTSVNRGAS